MQDSSEWIPLEGDSNWEVPSFTFIVEDLVRLGYLNLYIYIVMYLIADDVFGIHQWDDDNALFFFNNEKMMGSNEITFTFF